MFGFGLKDLVRALHSHELIKTFWEDHLLDGLGAMTGAWWRKEEARRSGASVEGIDLMREILRYNEMDYRVLAELSRYSRRRLNRPTSNAPDVHDRRRHTMQERPIRAACIYRHPELDNASWGGAEDTMPERPPLTDAIIVAIARLVDDSQADRREPAHSDIEFQIERAGLSAADPGRQDKPVGKSKRVRGVLSWALANDLRAGESLVAGLIATVQGYGGFRESSANFCGWEAIENSRAAFSSQGWELNRDGSLQPKVLDSLSGRELTKALRSYAERARRGALDNPLVTGTSKDLLEATAAHILVQKWGAYSPTSNFPTLLGQAFTALGLATTKDPSQQGESAQRRVERAAYQLGCSINALRNKEGTGHGRPWLSTVSDAQARFAIETMGNIASLMLDTLDS